MVDKTFVPSGHDTRRIAVEARCGVRAVRSLYRGDRVKDLTRIRILEAIERLALPPPDHIQAERGGLNSASGSGQASRPGRGEPGV